MTQSSPVDAATASAKRRPQLRVRPVQQRAQRKLDAILDATASLLTTGSIEAISILAIAEAAAVPPATVYHYFENRLAVFAAVAERTMCRVDAELAQQLQHFAVSPALSSRPLLQALFAAYREAPGYVSILRTLRAEPLLYDLIQESNQRSASMLATVLMARTSLPALRAARIGWILSEACEQILQAALMAEPEEAAALLDELVEMVDALFAHYLAWRG